MIAGRRIVIRSGSRMLVGTLLDTPTAHQVWNALPLEGSAERWGDELDIAVLFGADREPDSRQVLDRGELAFWCEVSRIVLALGPTPISLQDECRACAHVNVWGVLEGQTANFLAVQAGDQIRLDRAESGFR